MIPLESAYAAIRLNSLIPPHTAASACKIPAPPTSTNSLNRQRPTSISPVAIVIDVLLAKRACKSMASGENGSSSQYGLYFSKRRTYSIAVGRSCQALFASKVSNTSSPMALRAAFTRASSSRGDKRPTFILTALKPSFTKASISFPNLAGVLPSR